MNLKDSTGQVAGFLSSKIVYDTEILQQGLDKIDAGIRLYPDRLDMRFGKIYSLGQGERWEPFTEEIIKAIKYSKRNKNKWIWTFNKRKEGGEAFFLGSLQDYQLNLY